jgi:ABC-type nitrate/sulfonate/bicarbonate transport system ATPase subunit
MLMKAALLSSLAYRPKLLVLDEPFSGLDPLVRDEFIRGMLEVSAHGEWTVLVSSHDIEEVERLEGRLDAIFVEEQEREPDPSRAGRSSVSSPRSHVDRYFLIDRSTSRAQPLPASEIGAVAMHALLIRHRRLLVDGKADW